MAKSQHDKVEQRKRAAEAKKAANRAKRLAKKSPRQQRRQLDTGPLYTLVLICDNSTSEKKDEAWHALRRAEILPTYFEKFAYDSARRNAIVKGGFILKDVPFVLVQKIESELAPAWRRGSFNSNEPYSVDPVIKPAGVPTPEED
jgi:hypothetical protein